MEFYVLLFAHIWQDLLLAIEGCRIFGMMFEGFNLTFLVLISWMGKPLYFDDFLPISLCNCIDKMISKIIALYIMPILSRMISKEHFSFLHHHQIHEAIQTYQEGLHSIKSLSKKDIIPKIDLSKSYDHASWSYL